MGVLGQMVRHVLVLLLAVLVFSRATSSIVVAASSDKSSLALPGCREECGNGVRISYPFGIGLNCSRDKDFTLICAGDKPYLNFSDLADPNEIQGFFTYFVEVTEISIDTSEVRILTEVTQTCNGSKVDYDNPYRYRPQPTEGIDPTANLRIESFWYTIAESYKFSHTKNKLTAVGCNAFGALALHSKVYGYYGLGCLATCENKEDKLLADGSCSGFGCCQTSIPPGLHNMSMSFGSVRNDTLPWVRGRNYDPDGSLSCGYVFLVEANNYTFNKSHLSWNGFQPFPVVLDWFVKGMTCKIAQTNMSIYACKSHNSVCNDIPSGRGYFCNCSQGFQGNPYHPNGCQDVDECLEPTKYTCSGICINTPGSYTCRPNSKARTTTGIISGLGSAIGALFLFTGGIFLNKRIQEKKIKEMKKKLFNHNYILLGKQQELYPSCTGNIMEKIKFFSLKDIEKATNYFDSTRIVGQGGHGIVYKGLFELKVVAIKKPKSLTNDEIKEFFNEVILLSQISHKNVVQLIGCCIETEVPLLVYEFISNGSLFDQLHTKYHESPLSWKDRLRISKEISAGLSYLHTAANVSVLHRDIKSSNILLDDRLTAKISDFGASKTIEVDQTHISTDVQGTLGYMDPEYMYTGQLTDKSDVYSLGVIMVELLTGEKPTTRGKIIGEKNLISHFIGELKEENLFDLVDASLSDDVNKDEVEAFAWLALGCLNMSGKDRPTMKEVEMTLDCLIKGTIKKFG